MVGILCSCHCPIHREQGKGQESGMRFGTFRGDVRQRAEWGASWDTSLRRLESWAQSSRIKRSGLPFGKCFSMRVTAGGEGTKEVRKIAVGGKRGDSRAVRKRCGKTKQQQLPVIAADFRTVQQCSLSVYNFLPQEAPLDLAP